MTQQTMSILLVCVSLLFISPAMAMQAPNCHCFQQRSFSTDNPATVEPYLLATTNNSLLAVAFNIPKRSIVKDKMGGAVDADLWVGYGLAQAYPYNGQTLIEKKKSFKNWSHFARSEQPDPDRLPAALMAGLTSSKSDDVLADISMAQTLEKMFKLPASTTVQLLESGLDRQHLSLALMLALVKETTVEKVVDMAINEDGGWAKLTEAYGLAPDNMEAMWLMLLKQKKAAS